jgi:hypothetical protein
MPNSGMSLENYEGIPHGEVVEAGSPAGNKESI